MMLAIVVKCVCVSVGNVREPGKNSLTDRNAVREADSGGPKKICIR